MHSLDLGHARSKQIWTGRLRSLSRTCTCAHTHRWQGGVEDDEKRRRELADFTGFTGLHRGAETLVAAMPAGGWVDNTSDMPYAEHLSKTRAVPGPVQHVEEGATEAFSVGVGDEDVVGGDEGVTGWANQDGTRVETKGVGLMLGHEVPACSTVFRNKLAV